MKLAIASGKGGTGKTTFSTALAESLEEPVTLLDCDVEEPNVALFLQTQFQSTRDVTVMVPVIDNSKCNNCKKCAEFCEFNALTSLPGKTLIFPELCHNCGGCARLCPTGAISEQEYVIGSISVGLSGNIKTVQGKLMIGKAMSPPIIRAVKEHISSKGITIIDCPPGTSCPMLTAVRGADYTILVTEPTPFGLNDLILAVDTMKHLQQPFGVVINRSDCGDQKVREFCQDSNIPIHFEIKASRKIAEAYSIGGTILSVEPALKQHFLLFIEKLKHLITEDSQ